MIGIHSSYFDNLNITSINDVILVNLDIGSVTKESSHQIPKFPKDLYSRLSKQLSLILSPELNYADELYCKPKDISDNLKDKKIRAHFLMFIIELLEGYLSCVYIVRVHPTILIKFQTNLFLFKRNLNNCTFTKRFLETNIFNGFIIERGTPYRKCDIFDDLIVKYSEIGKDNIINEITNVYLENEYYLLDSKIEFMSIIPDLGHLENDEFIKLVIRDIKFNKIEINKNFSKFDSIKDSKKSLAFMGKNTSFTPLNINSYQFGLIDYISKVDANVIREFVMYLFENQWPRALQVLFFFYYL